jgi:hypothetical protein
MTDVIKVQEGDPAILTGQAATMLKLLQMSGPKKNLK